MKFKVALSIAGGLVVAACASTPESIAPAYVSEVTYQSWNCDQLSQEMARLNAAYTTVAAEQNHARTNDTVGVIFLGLPVSSLSGQNVSAQVANVKGNQVAVERAATLKSCTVASPNSSSPTSAIHPMPAALSQGTPTK